MMGCDNMSVIRRVHKVGEHVIHEQRFNEVVGSD